MGHRKQGRFWLGLWLLAAVCWPAAPAAAQGAPDMREIFPYLMLVIDTSGSMERLPACTCTTSGCEECLPLCVPDVNGDIPKNRWAVTLEALTGTFENFRCKRFLRTTNPPFTFDYDYYMPYHQPWECSGGVMCPFNSTPAPFTQRQDGILDEYRGRVNFGLITFDGFDTWFGQPSLVPSTTFLQPANLALSEGEDGLWSYGEPKTFHYPNCTTDYMMDTGARSSAADQGGLVSLNSCYGAAGSPTCPAWCGACWNTDPSEIVNTLNDDIQEALLATRPYGSTPIAASLDDLYHHLKNDLTDQFGSCRNRFALLMTDGYPDADWRQFGCDCDRGTDPLRCGPPPNDPAQMHCPYAEPEQIAFDLIHGRDDDDPMIEQLFVVGMAVDTLAVRQRLEAIADSGCPTAEGCDVLYANDLDGLVDNMSSIIQGFLHPISRSVPVFSAASVNAKQYQISTGFEVPIDKGAPWTGIIERRRFTCDGADVVEEDIDSEDLFHVHINRDGAPAARLFTTVPETGTITGHVFGKTTSTPCGATSDVDEASGCELVALNDASVTTTELGLGSTETDVRDEVLAWMYGEAGSPRAGRRLGDIYHSSPVVLSVPRFDTTDEAFNEFRRRSIVTERPLTMFVNTNDGMIRAFALEDYVETGSSTDYDESWEGGDEMWGFVPPLLLPRLHDSLSQHHITMDGTPLIKNVYFSRNRGAKAEINADQYRTVLITGMRGGGNAYIALDVTNPTKPQFLWQFTDPHMGKTYAQPGIVQAVFLDANNEPKNGAVAVLPGGVGEPGNSGITNDCISGASGQMQQAGSTNQFETYDNYSDPRVAPRMRHRSQVRCWRDIGRALYFVDIETGELIKKIHRDQNDRPIFASPVVSTPAIYQSDVGTRASVGFVVDADGVIWRFDMSATDQVRGTPTTPTPLSGWTARPFHDVFWDRNPTQGEAAFEAPILSVDDKNRLVVIVGTGDTDNFVKPNAENRVVSLTEVQYTPDGGTPPFEGYKALLNWEKRVKPTGGFVPSELVTGSMGLFARQLFFGTFIPVSGSNACDFGRGRVHAVDYIARDTTDTFTSLGFTTFGPQKITDAVFDTASDDATLINVEATAAISNLMVLGLGVTQRPSCVELDTTDFSVDGRRLPVIDELSEPSLYLVAQGSGNSGALLKANTGGRLMSVELKVNRPKTPTRVVSWATSVE